MKKLQPALAASLSVLVALSAFIPEAAARGGGGGFGGHGGFGGGHDGGFRPGGDGYGVYPGRPNPYARNVYPWINMDYGDLLEEPPNNSGSSVPNDCNYLFEKAVDSGNPTMWKLFNDCSHDR